MKFYLSFLPFFVVPDTPFLQHKALPEHQAACFRTVHPGLHKSILTNMRKLSFKSTASSTPSQRFGNSVKSRVVKMMEIGGTQHHFTRNGRLVANKQLIYKIDKEEGMKSVSKNKISCFI